MPAQLVTRAVTLCADPRAQLPDLGDQLIAREAVKVLVHVHLQSPTITQHSGYEEEGSARADGANA